MEGVGPRWYGTQAARYGKALKDGPIFVVGEDSNAAFTEMIEPRRKGIDLAAMLLLDDPRARFSLLAANDVAQQVGGYDEQRFHMDAIERGDLDVYGQTLLARSIAEPQLIAGFHEVARMASTIVVRSFAELHRLRSECPSMRSNVVRWFPRRELPPPRGSPGREAIVIWAVESPAEYTALPAFALDQIHAEVVIVTSTRPKFGTRFAHLAPDDAAVAEVLTRAACVLDVHLGDPGWAYAFTERGIPVAAASTCGADEFVDGLSFYYPWSHRSIAGSVARALGRGPGAIREPPPEQEAIEESLRLAAPEPPPRNPLVSIVVPTYNRRAMLEKTLRDLLIQTYANIEIVVVNDGGESVADLRLDPRITILDRTVNVGVAGALNAGVRASHGEYVVICADDDALYHDHVVRLVGALERTGCKVAHSNTLLCLEQVDARGERTTTFGTARFSDTIDAAESYAFHRVSSTLVHRSVYDEIGFWDESLFLADLDMLIRLAERYDFVHVPYVTSEWWARGSEQLSTARGRDVSGDLRKMFEKHPAPGRPYVAAMRARLLEEVAKMPKA